MSKEKPSNNNSFDAWCNDILHYLEKNQPNEEELARYIHREGYLNNVHYDIQTGEKSKKPLRVRFLDKEFSP